MPNRIELTKGEWRTFYSLLLLNHSVYVGSAEFCRHFLNTVLSILRSDPQWLLLPASLEKWNTVLKQFSKWCKHSIWQSLHKSCSPHPDYSRE
jgi:transposase